MMGRAWIERLLKEGLVVLLGVMVVVGGYVMDAQAHDVRATAHWAYNGDLEKTTGFKFYIQYPGTEEWVEIINVADSSLREWGGVISIEEGRNIFVMTAYGEGIESAQCPGYPLEYLHSESEEELPAPAMRFKITGEIVAIPDP